MKTNCLNASEKRYQIFPKAVWKDIPGYEGLYQVSNLGRVKSLQREVKISVKIK